MRKRDKSPMQRYTVKDFHKEFPTDDACLEWLKNHLYPEGIFCKTCDRVTTHHKVASRKSYSCQFCGHHVHPTAGTIYHKSTTPLTDWFYAVFLMASTRCGISAKQLEREIGVTYKTAWRMFNQIRKMLDEEMDQLSGTVEIDETYVGGRKYMGRRRGRPTNDTKGIVVGAVERKGRVIGQVVPDVKADTLIPFVQDAVEQGTHIYTDELRSYWPLRHCGYEHARVTHKTKIWVVGDAHTNSIEGFWSLLKGGIRGVYKHTSRKYLQSYVNEYAFRYNRRWDSEPMFMSFLRQVEKSSC